MFHTEAEEQDLYSRVLSRGLIDGIIISSFVENDPLIPAEVNYVDVDNTVGAHNVVTHLIRLGRRRIGYISDRSTPV